MPDLINPIIKEDSPNTGGAVPSNSEALLASNSNADSSSLSGWDKFMNWLRMYFGFSSGGPAAGNSQGSTNIGTNVPGAGSSPTAPAGTADQLYQDFIDDGSINGTVDLTDVTGTSAQTAGSIDFSSLLQNSAVANSDALQAYYELYQKTGNEAYLEKLFDSMLMIENTNSARSWDKMMSDTSFSRLVKDIENAGYNPWLALQNSYGSAQAYSTSPAGKSSVNANSIETSQTNARLSANTNITGRIISALLALALIALK